MFLDEVISLLEVAGIGFFGSNLFATSAATIPTGPGPYLSVIETAGAIERTHNDAAEDRIGFEHCVAHVRVRCSDYQIGHAMADRAFGVLLQIRNRPMSHGGWWRQTTALSGLTDQGVEAGRACVDFSVAVTRRWTS